MIPLIIVRPEPGASATLGKARELGLDAHAFPLFEVVATAWAPPNPDQFDAVMVTSANAIRFGGDALTRFAQLPLFAVGEATAAIATAAGFSQITAGMSGAAALVAQAEELGFARLLHLSGAEHTTVKPKAAAIERRIVYESAPRDPDRAFHALVAGPAVILIHSPRAGRRIAALCPENAHLNAVAISPHAAKACGDGWRTLVAAADPTDDAMLALAADLCLAAAT